MSTLGQGSIGIYDTSSGGTGATPALQAVTDVGNATTDNIILSGSFLEFLRTANNGQLTTLTLTASRVYSLPDKTGTIAMLSDIPASIIPTLQQVTDTGNSTTDNINLLSPSLLAFVQAPNNGHLSPTTLTGNRGWVLPDKNGTIAMTSDIPAAPTLQAVTDAGNTTTDNIILKGSNLNIVDAGGASGHIGSLGVASLSADRAYSLPDNNGTIALLSDIPSFPATIKAGLFSGSSTTFGVSAARITIPHTVGSIPSYASISAADQTTAAFIAPPNIGYYVTFDATNIVITVHSPIGVTAVNVNWQAFS